VVVVDFKNDTTNLLWFGFCGAGLRPSAVPARRGLPAEREDARLETCTSFLPLEERVLLKRRPRKLFLVLEEAAFANGIKSKFRKQ
jgi:hypothetical protein